MTNCSTTFSMPTRRRNSSWSTCDGSSGSPGGPGPRLRKSSVSEAGSWPPTRLSSRVARKRPSGGSPQLSGVGFRPRLNSSGKIPGAAGLGAMSVYFPGRQMPGVYEWGTTVASTRLKSRRLSSPGSDIGRTCTGDRLESTRWGGVRRQGARERSTPQSACGRGCPTPCRSHRSSSRSSTRGGTSG